MTPRANKIFFSNWTKKLFIVLALLLTFFFIFNDLLIPWYVQNGGTITVPSVVGLTYDEAKTILDSLGFDVKKGETRLDRSRPAGTVIIQNPIEGAVVKKGRRIYLTISGGEQLVTVPDLRGRTLRDARFRLEREGLKLGAIEYELSDEFPENTVIDQRIPPNTKVKRDVYVSIVLSQGTGEGKVVVPDVIGKSLSDATKMLLSNNLKIGNVTYIQSSDVLPNTVVDQYPRVGEKIQIGQQVDLIIVEGSEKRKDEFEY